MEYLIVVQDVLVVVVVDLEGIGLVLVVVNRVVEVLIMGLLVVGVDEVLVVIVLLFFGNVQVY